MTAFGQSEFTAAESPGELQFRVDNYHGWVILFAFPALCLVAVLIALALPSFGTRVGLAGTAGFCFLVWAILIAVSLKPGARTTTLSVTSQSLVATGAGLGSFLGIGRSKVVIQASEITRLGHTSGDDYSPSGFEVQCGFWKSKLVLPGLNREQCRTVADAILRRFPEIASHTRRES